MNDKPFKMSKDGKQVHITICNILEGAGYTIPNLTSAECKTIFTRITADEAEKVDGDTEEMLALQEMRSWDVVSGMEGMYD